jgi:hypothetical protein
MYGTFIAAHTPVYTARKVACGCGWSEYCTRDTTGHGLPWMLRFLYRRHIDALWRDLKRGVTT